ncbi:MAG: hypothetical protein HC805_08860 [Alkalinema sp. RL_2_19]|nr:hypothetical protein [Alkalinema sp. RL_2_19]
MPRLIRGLSRGTSGGEQLKVVVLDEDVAQVFATPEAVNHALRSLIAAMPSATSQ